MIEGLRRFATVTNPAAVSAASVAVVVVLPLLWWLKVAFVDGETEMLPPSFCGSWVVHPEWDIVLLPPRSDGPLLEQEFPPVVYRLEVPGSALAKGAVAEVTAMGSFRVRVGKTPCGEFGQDRGSWKTPVAIDLGACAGGIVDPNLSSAEVVPFVIQAQNESGPAPIRVCWSDTNLPATGEDGWAALTPNRRWRPAAVAGREISELRDKDFTWPSGPWGYGLLLASVALLALVGLIRGWTRRAKAADRSFDTAVGVARDGSGDSSGDNTRDLASIFVLVLIVGVYAWNSLAYPWSASRIDQGAHEERLRRAAELDWLPAADEMYQAYQPPLYYAVAGALVRLAEGTGESTDGDRRTESRSEEDLRPAQIFDGLVGICHALLAFWMLRRFGPASRRARALALVVVGLAPVVVTTYPMLGNETLVAFLCGAALMAGVVWLEPRRVGDIRPAALAGLLAALAMLTKYTGLMPAAALGVVIASTVVLRLQKPEDGGPQGRSVLRPAVVWLSVVALVAGPFYGSRWHTWGDPFIGNWDEPLGYAWEGEPGYRTLGFYASFGEVFFHAPERGIYSSFWDGLYASTWAEINDSWVPVGDESVNALLLVLMALALLPTMAGVAGLAMTVWRAGRRPPGIDLAFVAVTLFTVSSVAVYLLRVPFASTVKALFLLSLVVPATLFVARGYERMEQGLGQARWLLDLVTSLQVLLVLRLFVWVA